MSRVYQVDQNLLKKQTPFECSDYIKGLAQHSSLSTDLKDLLGSHGDSDTEHCSVGVPCETHCSLCSVLASLSCTFILGTVIFVFPSALFSPLVLNAAHIFALLFFNERLNRFHKEHQP